MIDRETLKQIYEKYEEITKNSRTKTSKEIEITRNTINSILYSEKPITAATKEKVLRRCLELMPHFTVGFLTQRMYDATSESLKLYLGQIYEELFDIDSEEKYQQRVMHFYNTLKEFEGIVHDKLETEAADMVSQIMLDADAKKFHIPPPNYRLETIKEEPELDFVNVATTNSNYKEQTVLAKNSSAEGR